jgi:outer membrane protein, heavy metal efflux system
LPSARRFVAAAAATLMVFAGVAPATAAAGADTLRSAPAPATLPSPGAEPAVTGALDSTPAPAVEDLVARALAHAPALAAESERQAAATARVAVAGSLPDLTLEAVLQDVGFPDYTVGTEEMSLLGVEARQNLLFFGKRGSRRAAARAEADQDAAEVTAFARRVTAEVRGLYAQLYALDQRREAIAAAREFTQLLAATAAARTGTGQAEWESQVKAQLAGTRLDERMDDLLAEREGLVAALNRYLDQEAGTPLGVVSQLPDAVPPARLEGAAAKQDLGWEARAPELLARRAAVTSAERRLAAERRDVAPNLYAAAGYGHRGEFDPVVTFRLGAELPLWRRGKAVGVGEHELAMAQHELRDAEAAARAEAARLLAAWRNADAQVRRYRQAILPQTSAAIDAARASYIAGRTDFSTLVEDYDLWLQAREQLGQREADRFRLWSELDVLVSPAGSPAAAEGSAR